MRVNHYPILIFIVYLKLKCAYSEVLRQPKSCGDLQEYGANSIGYHVTYNNASKPFVIYCGEEDGMTSTSDLVTSNARNCLELQQQGMDYDGSSIIYPYSSQPEMPVLVYCDQTTEQGGWTVIQRRINGSEEFYRGWEDYENGFGNVEAELWLGNILIHELTEQTVNEIRIELEDWEGEQRYANYKIFHIDDNSSQKFNNRHYQLSIALYSGTAGDSFSYHNGEYFATFDSDNDYNCAETFHGGWWFSACAASNLNGRYYNQGDTNDIDGIQWSGFHGPNYSHKRVSMKIRPFQGE